MTTNTTHCLLTLLSLSIFIRLEELPAQGYAELPSVTARDSSNHGHWYPVPQSRRLPDPRYRAPLGVWEIERVANMVVRSTGQEISGIVDVADDPRAPFAHVVHGIGRGTGTAPDMELRADIIGAQYAIDAGFDLAAHIGWTLARPNRGSMSHGWTHDRALGLAEYYQVSQEEIDFHRWRYLRVSR